MSGTGVARANGVDGDSRIIYLPVETRAREWDAKLLFSLLATAANFQVVLGPKWMLSANRDRFPCGLYGFKTLNKLDANGMRHVGALGHVAFAWDEEGPGQIRPEVYLKSIDGSAMEQAARIFAWGEHQAEMLARRFPEAAAKIEAAGNPRWDILRPEYRNFFAPEAQALRAVHGPFILINTNFSTYNSWLSGGVESLAHLGAQTGAFDRASEADKIMLGDIHDFEKGVFHSYKAMLPALSRAFPERKIIVRPHPTEKQEVWSDIAAPLPNVAAVHQGGVIPWLLAADAVVQNSCTTGVEALTLGKPVVSYCAFQTPLTEWHLTSHVTPRVTDESALIDCLRQFIAEPVRFANANEQRLKTLGHHIAQLSGATSAAVILKALHVLCLGLEEKGMVFGRAFEMAGAWKTPPITPYLRMKMPEVLAGDLARQMVRLTENHPQLARVKIMHLADSTFHFRRKP